MGHEPWDASYAHLIASTLESYRERIAFVHGDREITYKQCAVLISTYAQVILSNGVRPGQGVALVAHNSPEAWLVYAASLMIGCRFTPLQPRSSIEDWEIICTEADISILIFQAPVFSEAASILAKSLSIPVLGMGRGDVAQNLIDLASMRQPTKLIPISKAADIARLPFTGGTTGRSKGVILPHRSLVYGAWLSLTQWQLPEKIRFLACTPISHAALPTVFATLFRGGTVFVHEHFDADRFAKDVQRYQINLAHVVPTVLYVLLDHPRFDPKGLRSLETILYGASPMSPVRLEHALDVLGKIFVQVYGQTEAPSTISVLRKEDHDLTRKHVIASCGRPLIGVSVEIHDPSELECKDDDVGEICVQGQNVMDGYWKRENETSETLRNGWLHTGDLARRDSDGYLYIVDRVKDMIISGGFNIYPREVEETLMHHSSVSSAAVIGVPDPKWGESVKAIVVLKLGARASEAELIELVRKIKGSLLAPKSIDFIDAMPLTPLGKFDKKALRAPFWANEKKQVS